jgi:hypothetical protein
MSKSAPQTRWERYAEKPHVPALCGTHMIAIATAIPNTRHPNTLPGSGQVPALDF